MARQSAAGTRYQPVKPRRGETHPCEVCGNPVYRSAGQIAKGIGRFCSNACHNASQTKVPVIKLCLGCGKEIRLKPSQAAIQYCSKRCESQARTKRPLERTHNGWPARLDSKGYVMVYEPEHPNKSFHGWQYEHRLVVEAVIGRYLASDEAVHHINGVKDDNRPENLEAMDANDHAILSALNERDRVLRERAEVEEYRRRYGPLTKE